MKLIEKETKEKMKEHYFSQFYLKRWINETRKVNCFSIKKNNFTSDEYFTKSIESEEDLYSIKGVSYPFLNPIRVKFSINSR